MKKSKKIILPVIAAASMALSTFALADTTNTGGGGSNPPSLNFNSSGIIAAINKVGDKMVSLAMAGATAVDNAMYQFDKNLLITLKTNQARKMVSPQIAENTENATNAYIHNDFQSFPNQVLSTNEGMINAQKISAELDKQSTIVNSLTMQVPASDTLYSNNPQVIMAGSEQGFNIGPPKTNDDNYFNIASILTPMAYTPAQRTATQDYMAYLTKSYEKPSKPVDLASLQAILQNMKPSKQYQTLHNIISGQSKLGAEYQKYQLAMRSSMASKSIALYNFNRQIAERTPSNTAVSGIYNRNNKTITHPSPLQVESYIANRRFDNPAWIKGLQSKSSTTLQRETVVLLARIAQQNFQAKLDRASIILALSNLELQSSSGGQMMLKIQANQINKDIKQLGKEQNNQSATPNPNAKSAAEIAKEMSLKNNPAKG